MFIITPSIEYIINFRTPSHLNQILKQEEKKRRHSIKVIFRQGQSVFSFLFINNNKKEKRKKEIGECLSNMKATIHTLSMWMNDQFSSLFFFIEREIQVKLLMLFGRE
jgi:hypothetical protein